VQAVSSENREKETVQCQLVLQDGVGAVWPSNVYFLYIFAVNGERESTFTVRFEFKVDSKVKSNCSGGQDGHLCRDRDHGGGQVHLRVPHLLLRPLLQREPHQSDRAGTQCIDQ